MAKSATKTSDASPAAPANASPLPETYEAALQELELLLENLESGRLPLDALLGSYQRGAQLLTFCRSKLEAVENQIKVLEGQEVKPWQARQ
jgi:exodeoxyribonuclease VII small subunit